MFVSLVSVFARQWLVTMQTGNSECRYHPREDPFGLG